MFANNGKLSEIVKLKLINNFQSISRPTQQIFDEFSLKIHSRKRTRYSRHLRINKNYNVSVLQT